MKQFIFLLLSLTFVFAVFAQKQIPVDISIPSLTSKQYVQLAQTLMATYGEKTGELQKLNQLLEQSAKQTDGADMGAAFVMSGAGSASVYSIAWSAARSPDDLLTANNLGVALKNMGEYVKAIQVLQYANELKPNVGLVLCNLGWAYREAGDNANATLMFEKALKASPSMSSPYMGLGLIAQSEKNHTKAEQYLRKALTQKFSSTGFIALKQAREARSSSQQESQTRPIADEKGDIQGLEIPDIQVYDDRGKMIGQQESINRYHSQLGERKQQLISELLSVSERMSMQQSHATKDPDNSVVFQRDFSKEIMQFEDIDGLLFGENSNYAKASAQGTKFLVNNAERAEKRLPTIMQQMEQLKPLQDRYLMLMDELKACGINDICIKKVHAKMKKLEYEGEQLSYSMCMGAKGDLESSYSAGSKNYTLVSNALKEAIPDFYAFTDPIIERMYAPSINEFYNLYRELRVVIHLEISSSFAVGVILIADELNQLDCVEPVPPEPTEEVAELQLPEKEKKECPLGEKGIGAGMGVLSFELSCDHVKLSGGEGILWSVKRDFNKHETTIWGGVGVKGQYGRGILTAEASMGVEVTIGQGDSIKDVAFTSSVKAGVGGLAEAEISGRFALEGGPSVSADANLTPPSIIDLIGL
ncbi:MAG: hypothetical protein PHV53_04300 [Fermentimonas sp.]|nr:hypothetical protein [Fermentimonas sp.]